jgi:predicted Zn-dependent peptidase
MTPPPAAPQALELERHRLGNGLDVVLHRDPSLPLVAINLWYHVGSKHERPGRTGFAHLFEHMLFQGSAHVGTHDHFHYVQQVGGVANGSTWFDRTNYFETLPSHQLDLGLWLESDRMGFLLPALTPEKLETQRKVVMNERHQRIDNQPYGRAFERLQELLYPLPHPYHWPVIGYLEDIAAARLEEVEDFFRTYYTPANAVLTVAGDIDPPVVLARVESWFGELPAAAPPPAVDAHLPPLGREQREVLPDRVQMPRLYVAWRVPPFGHPDWYAADLLSTIWSTGKSSHLHHELVYRRQLAQSVAAWVLPTEEAATLCVIVTAHPGVTAQELEAALLGELDRFAAEPVTDGVLEQAKNRQLTDHYNGLQLLERRADQISQFATYLDDPSLLSRVPSCYEAVGPGDLLRLARTALDPDERVVLTVVPGDAG